MRTYEMYDENEYFIKFLKIHPFLSYATENYDKKKLQLQLNLLKDYELKKITLNDLQIKYTKIIEFEKKQKIYLENVKQNHKEKEKEIEININKNLCINIDKLF